MTQIRVNEIELHYEIEGEGEPVVFLNGVMMTTQSWALQRRVLAKRYCCILHDFRGQLLSAKPAGPYAMELHVEDLRALLDQLGVETCHLVGTSYGGEVGMIFAYTHPQRVASLTVISSVSHVTPLQRRQVDLWAETALREPQHLYRLTVPCNYSDAFLAESSSVIRVGEKRLAGYPPEFFPAFAELIEAFKQLDIRDRLADIRCPTLVICGEHDALKPVAQSRLIAQAVPGAEFLVVPDAGHAVVIEKAETVNTALLGFLEKWTARESS